MMKILFTLLLVSQSIFGFSQTTTLIFQDALTKEPICNVYVAVGAEKVFSDCRGLATLTGNGEATIRHIAYRDTFANLNGTTTTIYLTTEGALGEVTVSRQYQDKTYIPAKKLDNIPYLLGQKDVMSYIQTLPGVSNSQEGNTGINVRGGRTDETLILLDDAPIYNPNHVFGLFSAFNAGVVKSIDFYKDRFPAEYGGRNSSVLDINTKNGDFQKRNTALNLSILGGDISSNGYIIKDKLSYNIGGRASYANAIKYFTADLEAGYFDINTKLSYKVSDQEYVAASFYSSKDRYYQSNDDQNIVLFFNESTWSNTAASLKWYKNYKNGLRSKQVYSFSNLQNEKVAIYQETADFSTFQKMDVHHLKSSWGKKQGQLNINFGVEGQLYLTNSYLKNPDTSFVFIPKSTAAEVAPYAEASFSHNLWNYKLGTRYNLYKLVDDDMFAIPDISASVAYKQSNHHAYLAFDRTSQFTFQLYETFMPISSDFWILANSKVKPQISNMFSLGYSWSIKAINVSIGGYVKHYAQTYDYKDGALLYSSSDFQKYLTSATRRSAGLELSMSMDFKNIKADANYTLSKTTLQSDQINRGDRYPAFYDRPHLLNAGIIYTSKKNFSLTARQYLSSGRTMTYDYLLPIILVSSRNEIRLPMYHRLDVGMNWTRQNKKHKNRSSTFGVSIYNVYNNLNTYYIRKTYETGKAYGDYEAVTLFPIIPTVTYGVKF